MMLLGLSKCSPLLPQPFRNAFSLASVHTEYETDHLKNCCIDWNIPIPCSISSLNPSSVPEVTGYGFRLKADLAHTVSTEQAGSCSFKIVYLFI
jgi:hypothetical protein